MSRGSPASSSAPSTCACTASTARARTRGSPGTPCRPSSPAPTPRCRRSASTSRWPTPSGKVGADGVASDLVHSHTWYANLGGHLAGLLHGLPHVVSAHSLEPLRPWKAEQLGGGYALSSWAEKTAYEGAAAVIAVSGGMRDDILRAYPKVDPELVKVVHNGIDLDQWQRPTDDEAVAAADATVRALGIDPSRPAVVFVGRITRQKGLPYFLRAAELLPAGRPGGALRRRAGHAGDHGRGHRPGRAAADQAVGRGLDRADAAARRAHRGPHARHRVRVPVDLRAARHRQPRGHGGRAAGRRDGHRVASRRSSTTASPAGSCPSTSCRTARAPRWTRTGSSPTSPRRSPTCSATPRGPRSGGSPRGERVEDHFTWEAIAERTLEVYRGALPDALGRPGCDDAADIARRAIRSTSRSAVERWSACHRLTAAPSSCAASATIARSRAALASTRTPTAVEPVGQPPARAAPGRAAPRPARPRRAATGRRRAGPAPRWPGAAPGAARARRPAATRSARARRAASRGRPRPPR